MQITGGYALGTGGSYAISNKESFDSRARCMAKEQSVYIYETVTGSCV